MSALAWSNGQPGRQIDHISSKRSRCAWLPPTDNGVPRTGSSSFDDPRESLRRWASTPIERSPGFACDAAAGSTFPQRSVPCISTMHRIICPACRRQRNQIMHFPEDTNESSTCLAAVARSSQRSPTSTLPRSSRQSALPRSRCRAGRRLIPAVLRCRKGRGPESRAELNQERQDPGMHEAKLLPSALLWPAVAPSNARARAACHLEYVRDGVAPRSEELRSTPRSGSASAARNRRSLPDRRRDSLYQRKPGLRVPGRQGTRHHVGACALAFSGIEPAFAPAQCQDVRADAQHNLAPRPVVRQSPLQPMLPRPTMRCLAWRGTCLRARSPAPPRASVCADTIARCPKSIMK